VLNQTFQRDFEIVICNDDPQSDCSEIIEFIKRNRKKNHRISVYKVKRHLGMNGSHNLLISKASSRWVYFVHDDDFLSLECLQKIDKQLHKFKEEKYEFPGVVVPHMVMFGDGPLTKRYQNVLYFLKYLATSSLGIFQTKTFFREKGVNPNIASPGPVNKLSRKKHLIAAGGFDDNGVMDVYLNLYKVYPNYSQLYIADNLYFCRQQFGASESGSDFVLMPHSNVLEKLIKHDKFRVGWITRNFIKYDLYRFSKVITKRFSNEVQKHFRFESKPFPGIAAFLVFWMYLVIFTLAHGNLMLASFANDEQSKYIQLIEQMNQKS
jgi:glycosyltransferase involved in cell wall biosynthesis